MKRTMVHLIFFFAGITINKSVAYYFKISCLFRKLHDIRQGRKTIPVIRRSQLKILQVRRVNQM